MFSSPPDSPPTASSKRSLLPTAVINFNPKKNNTRSDLELSLAAIPTTSCSLYFTKKAHFALNYTEEKDRALIEIPAEVAKTTRRINEDLPPIPNFPLLFWFIQITLTAIGAFFLVAKPDNATAVNVALVSCSVLLVPFFILRSFVNSLVKEIRRLAHLYSETYYLQVRTGGVAWFWAEGGGFFTRGDALVVGLGVGHKILLVTEVRKTTDGSWSEVLTFQGCAYFLTNLYLRLRYLRLRLA